MPATLDKVSRVVENEIKKLMRDFRMTEEQARDFLISEYQNYIKSALDPRD